MVIKLIAFGQIAEITGKEFFAEATDIESLRASLNSQFPSLTEKKYAIAVNKKLIIGNVTLSDNDTVALMPPYSGG